MTLETLKARIAKELARGPVDIASFVGSYFPYDIQAGSLLATGFHMGLLRGQLRTNLVEFKGRITAIDDCPVAA